MVTGVTLKGICKSFQSRGRVVSPLKDFSLNLEPGKLTAVLGKSGCGKTTLFNALTGSNQHVGNFPGVTVEQKSGTIKRHPNIKLVDLPGIYSLTPYTMEEIVSTDFLIREKPSMIINIIDATSIERNLYLTMQLLELNIPMILALNMMDEVINSGNCIDVEGLQDALGIKVVPISASKNEGIEALIEAIEETLTEKNCFHLDLCSGEIHKAIHSISHLIEENINKTNLPNRFAVTKVIEGNEDIIKQLQLDDHQLHIIDHIIKDMEQKEGLDKDAALVEMRYQTIESITSKTVFKEQETNSQLRSEKIDAILTHKYFGIPIFILIMLLIFVLTFNVIGAPLQTLMENGIDFITNTIIDFLKSQDVATWLISLLQDGVFAGVGSVLSFLPLIVVLFFFLSMLEDSGYMARVAFVMDKLLRKIGLSGKSFVPMLIGFGCSVPAIMASRTLSSQRDRKMTIIVTPFMSCSAKLPIYGMIIAAFFSDKAPLVMITIYCIGILVVIKGCLRTYIVSDEGKEVTLYRLNANDVCVLSAACVLDCIDFDVLVEAQTKCQIIQISPAIFLQLFSQNIHVELFSYKLATERFSDVMWAMQQILFISFDKRLAAFLFDESNRSNSLDIKMTHEQIAQNLNSAREVVSRMLNYFAKEGYVSLSRGQIHIIDKQSLSSLI